MMFISYYSDNPHPSISKDGKIQATGEKTLSLITVETQQKLISFSGHRHRINCSDFSYHGKYVLSGSGDNGSPYDFSVRIWEISSGKMLAKFKSNFAAIIDAKFTSDDEHVLILDQDQIFYIYSIIEKKVIHTQRPQCFIVPTKGNSVAREGMLIITKQLVASLIDNALVFWDWNSGTIMHTIAGVHRLDRIWCDDNGCSVSSDDQKYTVIF